MQTSNQSLMHFFFYQRCYFLYFWFPAVQPFGQFTAILYGMMTEDMYKLQSVYVCVQEALS